MVNWTRLATSVLLSLALAVIAYLLPFTLMLYFFAPGFWLGDVLPAGMVNALGGYFFPVAAATLIWAIVFYLVLWRITKSRVVRTRRA